MEVSYKNLISFKEVILSKKYKYRASTRKV